MNAKPPFTLKRVINLLLWAALLAALLALGRAAHPADAQTDPPPTETPVQPATPGGESPSPDGAVPAAAESPSPDGAVPPAPESPSPDGAVPPPPAPPFSDSEEFDRPPETFPQFQPELAGPQPEAVTAEHPFLLLKKSQYTELQNRAASQPWAGMKSLAIQECNTRVIDTAEPFYEQAWQMREIVSACGLAYVVDPPNRPAYKTKLLSLYQRWDYFYPYMSASSWNGTVPAASAFFDSLLTLDIIHDDLTSAELSDAESNHAQIGEWFWTSSTMCCEQAWYSTQGIWAIYKGQTDRINSAKTNYRKLIFEYLTPDGIYTNSLTYAHHRLSAIRDPKSYFMDVLEFTGLDPNYYNNPRLKRFYEWNLGQGLTPFRSLLTFGDTSQDYTPGLNQAASYRAHRFSAKAAGYAAWLNQGLAPEGRLITYVLHNQAFPAPVAPTSQIDATAGAWFFAENLTPYSLSAALWNPIAPSLTSLPSDPYTGAPTWSHSHSDVNAVHLAAYGEHLLRNGGYNGFGVACDYDNGQGNWSASWNYIHLDAESSNTIKIDGVDHVNDYDTGVRAGRGVVEGLTSTWLDYASGDSYSALSNGLHLRSLVFVHPQNDLPGYFLLFDEVDSKNSGGQANVFLHPNANLSTTISANQEYDFPVYLIPPESGHTNLNPTARLTIFLGTAPASVALKSGCLASWDYDFAGQYLASNYNLDSSGKANIVSVLFPSDATHPKASFQRVSGGGFSGARVSLPSGVTDVALESHQGGAVSYGGYSFQGLASFYRIQNGRTALFFVRKGTSFRSGVGPALGFDSPQALSLTLQDKSGRVVTPGGELTLYYPGITAVQVDGVLQGPTAAGAGWARFNLAAGTHQLVIQSPVDLGALSTYTLLPVEDAEADSYAPDTAAPAAPSLRVDAGPVRLSYLRFDLGALSNASIASAVLRVYGTDGSTSTLVVKSVADTSWQEESLTYNNRPPVGASLASFVPAGANTWNELGLSWHFLDKQGQLVSLAIDTGGDDGFIFNSKEAAANRVELVLSYYGGSPQPPTHTPGAPTATGPATATRTPTPTLTRTPTPTGTRIPSVTPSLTPTPTTPAGDQVFLPAADTEANASYPTQPQGSSPELGVDGSPVRIAYLKFDLTGLAGQTITSAKLRLYVTNRSTNNQQVREVTNTTWTESSLTYNNRPGMSALWATVGGTAVGQWKEIDLTSWIKPRAGTVFAFAIQATGGDDSLIVSSREAASNRPELRIQVQGGSPPTATRTPTPMFTPTPTSPAGPTATPGYQQFLPVADAEAGADFPSTPLGAGADLGVDGSPVRLSYFKFDLTSLAGKTLTSAKLRLYVTNRSTTSQRVREVTNTTWTESALTYNNRPSLGSAWLTFSGTTLGQWKEIDLTNWLRTRLGTVFSFAIETAYGDDSLIVSSREATNKPELIIVTP